MEMKVGKYQNIWVNHPLKMAYLMKNDTLQL